MRYKFVDDATVLESIDLKRAGIMSYNVKNHVPSDIPTHNQWIPLHNINSQLYLNQVKSWTDEKLMKVNSLKTKTMIFNYTDNYLFATRLLLDNNPLETVTEFKLLGTIITSDLRWDKNTNALTERAYSRMRLLHKVIEFGYPIEDLIQVYILYLRSLCEQSAVVCHSSLTVENEDDIERVQKTALK